MRFIDPDVDTGIADIFKKVFVMIVGTLVFGIVGYELIEGWNLLDSFYMTVITLSTVGFGEINRLSNEGRIFTAFLISFGIGVVGYTIGSITKYVIEGELKQTFKRKKMMKEISNYKDHVILCGYGRTGRQVTTELEKAGKKFVVIDVYEEGFPEYVKFPVIIGNATEDEILLKAGIERASGLITCLKEDADNIFVTLTARQLNHKLTIVSRCLQEKTEGKLYRAGANKVILPLVQVGKRLARIILNPDITSFIDVISGDTELDLNMDEFKIGKHSHLDGKILKESGIREKTNAIVVAIKKRNDDLIVNPMGNEELSHGDSIIVLCENDKLDKLREIGGSVL